MDRESVNVIFSRCNEEGIYQPHHPIYGFGEGSKRRGHSEVYILTYRIFRALSQLEFNSLLDVGMAEGGTAYRIMKTFNVRVEGTDLSDEGCKRAEEIFGLRAKQADIHALPYADEEFDVVTCTETLEHASDPQGAVEELLRIAKQAVIITVPHDTKEFIENNRAGKGTSSHINMFDITSFDYLKDRYALYKEKVFAPLWLFKILSTLIEAAPRQDREGGKHPQCIVGMYNRLVPLLRKAFGKRGVASLVKLDAFMSRYARSYKGALFVVFKEQAQKRKKTLPISLQQIIDFSVPYHYLRQR